MNSSSSSVCQRERRHLAPYDLLDLAVAVQYNGSSGVRLSRHGKSGEVTQVTDESRSAVAEQVVVKKRVRQHKKPKRQPRYSVILWDDQDHTYAYVIAMMQAVFGHPAAKGFQIAQEVNAGGRAIVLTTTKEHSELKRDQIHAYGKDPLIEACAGSMWATIEPLPE